MRRLSPSFLEKMLVKIIRIYIFYLTNFVLFFKKWSKHFTKLKLVECFKIVNNVLPEERSTMMKYKHEGKTNHRSIEETSKTLKLNYYWKSMKKYVTDYINACEICHRAKYNRKPPNEPLVLTETPSKPFEIIHIDTYKVGTLRFLTILDKFSKFG